MYPVFIKSRAKVLLFFQISIKTEKKMNKMHWFGKKFVILYTNCYLHISICYFNIMSKIVSEFKEFAMRGNVMDMAVGVIIGGAFGKIVTSLVEDIIMPLVSKATGGVSFVDLFINLGDGSYKTLADAKKAGAAVLAYGQFVQNILDFIIIAFCIFLMIKAVNKVSRKKKEEAAEAPAEPSAEEKLLTEIRDLLAKK